MIDNITLKNFTNFEDNTFTFCKGINVFIGKNGTGKTHILKCLAAMMHVYENNKANFDVEGVLMRYFKPDAVGNLVKKRTNEAEVNISYNNETILCIFGRTPGLTPLRRSEEETDTHTIYIPPREMLSLFEGFLGLVEKREISFDETYISLAKALSVPLLRKDIPNPLQSALSILEKELHFEVVQTNGRFYIKDDTGTTEAHLVAEGMRKLASVMYLILNGELSKDSILFWDEPESNLNPVLIKATAMFILELGRCGVQVFIATHDYLLTSLLSLYAEYREENHTPDTKFFCLRKDNDSILVEEGDTMVEIDHDPILHEHAAFYDLEQSFIWK